MAIQSTQWELPKNCKRKLFCSQFSSKSDNSSFDWWKTLKSLLKQIFQPNICKKMWYLLAKNLLLVSEKFDIWHTSKSMCAKKNTSKLFWGVFFQHKVIYLCAEFQLYLTPSTGFLPIDIPFFANIVLEYFFNKFLRVFHQSKLELSDSDENWAKTSPLLLQIFESSNCVDSHIVHCVNKSE